MRTYRRRGTGCWWRIGIEGRALGSLGCGRGFWWWGFLEAVGEAGEAGGVDVGVGLAGGVGPGLVLEEGGVAVGGGLGGFPEGFVGFGVGAAGEGFGQDAAAE